MTPNQLRFCSVLTEIKTSSDIDLLKLASKPQEQGIVPQRLFETDNGTKRCRVWLE
jgi:hypothetical protein